MSPHRLNPFLVLLIGLPAPLAASPLTSTYRAEAGSPGSTVSLSLPYAAAGTSPQSGTAPQLDPIPLLQATGRPPLPGSTELREDLAVLRWLQLNRTPQMIATTWTTLSRDVTVFSPAVGVDMVKSTPALLRGMAPFMALVDQGSDAIKTLVRRPRPFSSHPDLKPCLPLETGFSFPSGHSSWYAAAALLLSDLLPERRERILELGSYGGANRVMCGVHYPSDVLAAQRFAGAAAAQIIASPQWQRFRADPVIQAELAKVVQTSSQSLPILLR